MPQEQSERNTLMRLNEVYFWTDTVKEWKHLLKQDRYKQIIVDSWRGLIVSIHLSHPKNKIYGHVKENHINPIAFCFY
jgi:hypothetical protein